MASPARPTAVLFDIDGTLVDSNYLHVSAWSEAFEGAGFDVSHADIHRHVGMGSSLFMESLIGEARDDVKDAWRRRYDELKPTQRALPGARALLVDLAGRGVRVGLATSAPAEDLEALVETIDAGDAVSFTTSAGDVHEAKPDPGIFQTALEEAGCAPEEALVVGDTVWDVQAASRAGLPCVAVLTGGIGRCELEAAGAVAVYNGAADLLDRLDGSPLWPKP